MSLNTLRKRLEAIEQAAALRNGGHDVADVLSPRDAAFLLVERQTLEEVNAPESAALVARIDILLHRHGQAVGATTFEPLTPEQATRAFEAANSRTEEDGERYRREWLERLEAMA